jgi:hypothetical protein
MTLCLFAEEGPPLGQDRNRTGAQLPGRISAEQR